MRNNSLPACVVTIFYDGQCPVCCRFLAWVNDHWPTQDDSSPQLTAISTHSATLAQEFPKIAEQRQLTKQILVMSPSAKVYGGLQAVGLIFKYLPKFPYKLLGHLLFNPVIATLGTPFYRLFAANRQRISQWLGMRLPASSCASKDQCESNFI
jgi:predicted DCC family thiol-disulfide oxidoreductase YuxK